MNKNSSSGAALVQGEADGRFRALRELFEHQLESGEELGASLAVVVDGRPVVDLWGGFADEKRTRRWDRDTLTNVWSLSKTVTALAALVLADRGLIELDAPVARYWPEFAQNGKDAITVKQVLSHTSGVSGWQPPFANSDIYNHDLAAATLAAQAPWWQPGTASGYHMVNYGHLIGEIVRRVTGQRLGEFVRAEISVPLGADFHLGIDAAQFGRISNVVPPPPVQFDLSSVPADHPAPLTFHNAVVDATATWTPEWRAAGLGANGGQGNARSVARIQSVITNGGSVDGVRLLSPRTIDRIFEVQADGLDLVLFVPLKWGIGYALPSAAVPALPQQGRIAYWAGWGGSFMVNDLDRRMTFAYVMNKMSGGIVGSPRSDAYVRAVYSALD